MENRCRGCGIAYPQPKHGREKIWCSNACRSEHVRYYVKKVFDPLRCSCGTMFTPKSERHKWCSDRCKRRNSGRRQSMRMCRICNVEFNPQGTCRLYCSPACSNRVIYQAKRSAKIQKSAAHRHLIFTESDGSCVICAGPLPKPRLVRQKMCSDLCRKRHSRRRDQRRERATPHGRIKKQLSSRLREVVRKHGAVKEGSTRDRLGCTLQELVRHLESQFLEGMTWENYGVEGWHVDHIVPCARFDLSRRDHQDVCFNYRNLRPLWGAVNWGRQDSLVWDEWAALDPAFRAEVEALGIKEPDWI